MLAVIGNILAPGMLDRYLARMAYEAQVRPLAVSEARSDNLFAPVAPAKGLHKSHGSFDSEARERLTGYPASWVKVAVFGAAALLLVAIGYGFEVGIEALGYAAP